MGQFSWLDCVNKKYPIRDNCKEPVYVLVPEAYIDQYADEGKPYIKEDYYDGYGHFGKYDIYDLVAEWNRGCIVNLMQHSKSILGRELLLKVGEMFDSKVSDEEITAFIKSKAPDSWLVTDWKRNIGISIACYDEDNARCVYPIKITHKEKAVYEKCKISLSDPNQGWGGPKYPYDKYMER